jgi:hypothetical protein
MRFYKFCNKSLTYDKVNILHLLKKYYIVLILSNIIVGYLSIKIFQMFFIPDVPLTEISQINQKYEKILIAEEANKFTEDKFICKIKELNINFLILL